MSSLQYLHKIIKPVVSSYHELLCSLHVLYQPEHHPKRLIWAKEMTASMPPSLMEDLQYIGRLSDSWLGLMLPMRSGKALSCTEGISLLKEMPDAELIYLLLNDNVSLGTVLEWLHGYSPPAYGRKLEESGRYLLENLEDIRKLLIPALEIYERDYFRKEWDYILPWMNSSASGFMEISSLSAEKALNTLHPRLHAGEGKITAQKAVTSYFTYDQLEHIYVLPSTFIFPHLLMDWSGDSLMLPLAVDIPGLPYSEAPPEDLLRQFKALGDETRLRILKLLWQGPHCTKQLAPILGISEAAVSKQLKQLSEARLVSAERRGNYLFYSSQKEAFNSLIILQRQYFEQ